MLELVSYDEYGRFFDEVLRLDHNIRFVAIHDGQFKAKYRIGILEGVTKEEIKQSFFEASNFQETRKKANFKLDEPKFTMSQHEEINRIIIPFGNTVVILVNTELDIFIDKLVEEIKEISIGFLS